MTGVTRKCIKQHVTPAEVDAELARLGAAQWGVFTSVQCLARGISMSALKHRVRLGWIIRVKRGIYRLRDHPWLWESRLQAAVFDAGPGAVVSHSSGARLHGCWAFRTYDGVDVLRREGTPTRVTLGRVHNTSWLPPEHVTVIDGLPVTTLARTCFDIAGDVPAHRRNEPGREAHARFVERILNDALARRGLTFFAEMAVLLSLAKRGRSGTVIIRSLLTKFGPKYVPTKSDGESLFIEVLRAFGEPEPERQVRLGDDDGVIGTVDFLYRAAKVVVEIDSSWHDGPLDEESDALRDKRLRAIGYEVVRIRSGDLVRAPGRVMKELRQLLASRAPGGR